MTTVRINYKDVSGVAAKTDLLKHYEVQARKAARRLRTALAKWSITRGGIEGAIPDVPISVEPLAKELITWVHDAIVWSFTAGASKAATAAVKPAKKAEPKKAAAAAKTKTPVNVVTGEPKKAAARRSVAKKVDPASRADAQLKAKRAKAAPTTLAA